MLESADRLAGFHRVRLDAAPWCACTLSHPVLGPTRTTAGSMPWRALEGGVIDQPVLMLARLLRREVASFGTDLSL